MAKQKKLTIREILVKLSNIFPSDMYVIHCRYIVEGPKSKEQNCGYYSVYLTEESTNMFQEHFSKKDIIYFSDVKKAKDELKDYTSIVKEDEKIKEIIEDSNKYIRDLQSIEKWHRFHISDKEINDIFEGMEVEIQFDKNIDQRMMFSKSLLPLITKTTFSNLYFHSRKLEMDKKENDIIQLIMSFDHEYFQFYMTYNILLL